MRKLSFFLILTVALSVFVACGKKEKAPTIEDIKAELLPQTTMELSTNDTTTVTDLTNQFLDLLKNKDLDGAMGMIYYLKNGEEIVSLPEDLEKQHRMVLGNFLGLSYRIESIKFLTETDCQVRYAVTLFEKKDDDPVSNQISFFIKPVRRHGQWYLTMADSQTDSTHGSNIQN